MSEEMKDPRYRMLQSELRGMNSRLDALIQIQKPKDFILDLFSISKAAAFTETRVECGGADLIQISSDGDLTQVSYKILHVDGSTSKEMEAAESPHILGPIVAVFVTNDTAEAGKTVRIARNQGNPAALAAIKHGTPGAIVIASSKRQFYAEIEEYTSGAPGYFETDQAWGTTPTLSFAGSPLVNHILIHTIKHQITPTNAVTYQLWLLEAASAVDEQSEADIIYDSGAGQVGGTIYHVVAGGSPSKLPISARLLTAGEIYYMIDWSAAPGDSSGYIKVYGEVLA